MPVTVLRPWVSCIRNLALRDPLVTLDATNGNAISIAGQNNRFNRFTVDGVAFGDRGAFGDLQMEIHLKAVA